MRYRYFSRSILVSFLFTAIPFASVSGVATPAATASDQTVHLSNLQTRGAAEIDRRITNLSNALTKLTASTKLTPADKTALQGQINTELTGLAALKGKLAADTDVATAHVDVQAIVNDYRVYVLMLPKTRLIATIDRFIDVEDKLTSIDSTLQTKVNADRAAGKDTASMQASLDDLKSKIADATSKTDGMTAQLLALVPTDYNADHAILLTFHQSLIAAQTDVKTARDDATSVASALSANK
jgi:hypothetical protein